MSFNFFYFFPLLKFCVKENSMSPFLKTRDRVLVIRFLKPKIGDVVVFKFNKRYYIKRVAQIKDNEYFVTGDNKKESVDSRRFGWIDKKDIIGKVIYKI